jgi:chromate transporter
MTSGARAERGTVGELVRLFGRLGVVGFGGPPAHIAMLEDEIVRRRGWLSLDHFVDALAATNLIPGPNSTELAIHVGHARRGVAGGIAAGVAFIAPAFVLMLVLSWAYFRWTDVAAVAELFEGVQPAVIAVLVVALSRLFRSSVRDVPQLVLMAVTGGLAYAFTGWEPLILIAAGLAGILLYARPASYPRLPALCFVPLPLAAAFFAWDPGTLGDLASVFLYAGGLLFGGGYVLIPLTQDAVVSQHGWLSEQQFLDGVALGQMTPGPIIVTATFVGYAAAGFPGAVVATVAVFAPAFFFAIAAGSFLGRIRSWRWAQAFLKGVGPAVIGSIAAVAARLAPDAIDDAWRSAVFVAALAIGWRYGPVWAIVLGGGAGIAAGQITS